MSTFNDTLVKEIACKKQNKLTGRVNNFCNFPLIWSLQILDKPFYKSNIAVKRIHELMMHCSYQFFQNFTLSFLFFKLFICCNVDKINNFTFHVVEDNIYPFYYQDLALYFLFIDHLVNLYIISINHVFFELEYLFQC